MKNFFESALILFIDLFFVCAIIAPILLCATTGLGRWVLLYFIIIPCRNGWNNYVVKKDFMDYLKGLSK